MRQSSRCKWQNEGDLNTTFFHKSANIRRKNNNISAIYMKTGILSDDVSIREDNSFKNLFDMCNNHKWKVDPDFCPPDDSQAVNLNRLEEHGGRSGSRYFPTWGR